MCICHQATFHRYSIFKSVGFFNPKYKIAGDYDFLIRALVKRNKIGIFFNEFVSIMGVEGISSNKNNGLFIAKEMYKSRIENNIFPLTLRWIRHLIAGIFYKIIYYLSDIKNSLF